MFSGGVCTGFIGVPFPLDDTRGILGRNVLDDFGGNRGRVAKGELSEEKLDVVRTQGASGTALALGDRIVLVEGVGDVGTLGGETEVRGTWSPSRGAIGLAERGGVGKNPVGPRHPDDCGSSIVAEAARGGCVGIGCAGKGE